MGKEYGTSRRNRKMYTGGKHAIKAAKAARLKMSPAQRGAKTSE